MKDLFISHAEQDGRLTKELASGLEKRGFTTWYYERDSVPGLSYLLQTAQAIRESKVVVLIISKSSLCSNQVTKEVVRAHEENKPFLPILFKLSHVQFQSKQDEWREALGSAASISVSRCGISDILPRIEQGLQALRIMPASTCSSGLQGADRFTLMKTHVSSRAGTPAKNVKPYNALQKAKSSRKPAGVNRQEVTIFAQDPVEPSLPSADSQLLHESECVYSKQCLVNLASLGLTKASLLELVQGEFRSHMNYFRFDLENYPLPLRSGFVAYINKTGNRLEFTGLVKCSANEVKLA
ncbi:MAG: toll/interleukin-1 receptor domain-containing protein, partial [bacterium]